MSDQFVFGFNPNPLKHLLGQHTDKKHNFYSSKWGNNTWLKKNGVNGYIHSVVNYDVTGDIDYKYKGVRKVRHHESF